MIDYKSEGVAMVWCDGHARPNVLYGAACHEDTNIDDVVAVPARDASGPGCWYVGPKELLSDLPSAQVWPEDLESIH